MMTQICAGDLITGARIVTQVRIKCKDSRIRTRSPREIGEGDTVIAITGWVDVENITAGISCKGIHVNCVIRPPYIKDNKGKYIPNPENGKIVHSDGCYDRAARVYIAA